MATLREFRQLSYVATVLRDEHNYTFREADQQVVPDHLLELVERAEAELSQLTDEELDNFGAPTHEDDSWDQLAERCPAAAEVINHIYQDELWEVFFLTADEED